MKVALETSRTNKEILPRLVLGEDPSFRVKTSQGLTEIYVINFLLKLLPKFKDLLCEYQMAWGPSGRISH